MSTPSFRKSDSTQPDGLTESAPRSVPPGRGAGFQPANRFERLQFEDDLSDLEPDDVYLQSPSQLATEYFVDATRSIISENQSPDIPFRWSLNPYRGCAHGCAYCYARPTHEYFGLSAGLDFESMVFVKTSAPRLFRDWLARDKYKVETVMFSGVTDCYQPAEKQFALTRGCLEVALEARQPIVIVTKNALVTRDLDILRSLAQSHLIRVGISITTLDKELARTMEPRTSTPQARLRTIRELHQAGIPTLVMVAPVIPGLNDCEIPHILRAAHEAGVQSAGYVMLRLPLTVEPVFLEWLQRTQPLRYDRVVARIKDVRGGKTNDATFGRRMRGTGVYADQIAQTFHLFQRRYGLDNRPQPLDTSQFHPPVPSSGQLRLF